MQKLRERGVGTQVHYRPVHQQPFYQRFNKALKLEGAEQYYESCLSLPINPSIPLDKNNIEWLRVLDEII